MPLPLWHPVRRVAIPGNMRWLCATVYSAAPLEHIFTFLDGLDAEARARGVRV